MDRGDMSEESELRFIQPFCPEVSNPFLQAVLSREGLYSQRGPTLHSVALEETKSEGRGPMYWLSIAVYQTTPNSLVRTSVISFVHESEIRARFSRGGLYGLYATSVGQLNHGMEITL